MINTSLFPYETFPIRLEHQDKQKGMMTCFFQCEEHLEKYLEQGKLDRKKCVILRAGDHPVKTPSVEQKPKANKQPVKSVKTAQKPKANEQPLKPRQTDKKQMVSRPRKVSSGSTNTSGKLPSNLDSTGNSNQPRKPGRPRKNP